MEYVTLFLDLYIFLQDQSQSYILNLSFDPFLNIYIYILNYLNYSLILFLKLPITKLSGFISL
jgi:hypothetical protein